MKSIEDIWTQYRSALHGFLMKRVRDEDDVDDILQEVLIKTHAGLPNLHAEENLKAWLYKIASNAAADHFRRKAKTGSIHSADLWYEDESPGALVDLEGCVAPFLRGLPEADARLLKAVDLEGMPQRAYAEQHGIKYSTLKSQVSSARQNLRRLFDQCCQMTLDAGGRLQDFDRKSDCC